MHKFEALLKQLRVDPNNEKLKQDLQLWLRENADDDEAQLLWKEHWQQVDTNLSLTDQYRLEKLLTKIHDRAGISEPKSAKRKRRQYRINYRAIAASLLIPLFILSVIYYFSQKSGNPSVGVIVLETGTANQHFFLPDSTEVWLNSGSRLEYSKDFSENPKRLVSLSGQAYFSVYHDKKHPFIVQTAKLDIRVLGTHFDVSAYNNDPTVSSTLEEGSIAVLNKAGKQLDKLVPGEQYALHVSNMQASKTRVQTTDFTSWKNGKLIFKEASFNEVARKLERRYGCSITISEELQRENPIFNFSVTNESIDELCELIELAAGADYKQTASEIHFTKK